MENETSSVDSKEDRIDDNSSELEESSNEGK